MLLRMMTKSILWRLLFNAGVSFSTGFEALSFDTISIWLNGFISIIEDAFPHEWQNPFFDGCFSKLVWVFPLALRRFRLIPFRSDSMVLFLYHWRCFSAGWRRNPFFDGCFSMLVWVFPLALRRFRLIPFRSDLMVMFLSFIDDALPHDDKIHSLTVAFQCWCEFFHWLWGAFVWYRMVVFFIYHWRCFSAWWQNPFFDGGFSMLVWVFPLALRRLRLIPLRSELMVLFLSIIEDASPHDDKIHSSTVAFQCWYEFFHWLWGAFVWYHFDLTQWFYFSIIEGVFPHDDKIHSLTVAFQCWFEFFQWLWGAFVWYHFDLN